MDKEVKLDLLRRALGLKHKIKVHDSMPRAETHEQLAMSELARAELDEELAAIEQILLEARQHNIAEKREDILRNGVKVKRLETREE